MNRSYRNLEMKGYMENYRTFRVTTPQGLTYTIRTKLPGKLRLRMPDGQGEDCVVVIHSTQDQEFLNKAAAFKKENQEVIYKASNRNPTYRPGQEFTVDRGSPLDVHLRAPDVVNPINLLDAWRKIHDERKSIATFPVQGQTTHRLLTLGWVTIHDLVRLFCTADWLQFEAYDDLLDTRRGKCIGYKGYLGGVEDLKDPEHRKNAKENGEYPWISVPKAELTPPAYRFMQSSMNQSQEVRLILRRWHEYWDGLTAKDTRAMDTMTDAGRKRAADRTSAGGNATHGAESPAKRQRRDENNGGSTLTSQPTELDDQYNHFTIPARDCDIPSRYRQLLAESYEDDDVATVPAMSAQPTLLESDFDPDTARHATPATSQASIATAALVPQAVTNAPALPPSAFQFPAPTSVNAPASGLTRQDAFNFGTPARQDSSSPHSFGTPAGPSTVFGFGKFGAGTPLSFGTATGQSSSNVDQAPVDPFSMPSATPSPFPKRSSRRR
ncbi:hypothetical protein BD626DRAFT_626650 [Schizophyllum amplum]|uniref:Uncharacterized protein n=1 Tax=Schizophyllum amplum TaxID=97359 RepID=A0A550CU70_9AGAR|nr:hypothetical protein BD626DRAFT_626650 [Auriculariopsis ampla]